MIVTIEAEVIQDHGGALLVELLTDFGNPVVTVARERVTMPGVVMAKIAGSDPT